MRRLLGKRATADQAAAQGRKLVILASLAVERPVHQATARPFDRSRFVLELDDRSRSEGPFIGPDTALRHYVSPLRHEFWSGVA
jgi:hypothetical protein